MRKILYKESLAPGDPDHGHEFLRRETEIQELHKAYVKRFYGYPVHEACYKQSYLAPSDALNSVDLAIATEPNAVNRIDSLGMSLFHVLALSTKPRISLFQKAQVLCPRRLLEVQDVVGKRPLEYLCANTSVPNEERRILIEYLAQLTLMHRASNLGLSKWKTAVTAKIQEGLHVSECKQIDVAGLYKVLERYEQKEMISLLELEIWLWALHGHNSAKSSALREHKRMKLDVRQIARVNCGGDIIIANVVPFFSSL